MSGEYCFLPEDPPIKVEIDYEKSNFPVGHALGNFSEGKPKPALEKIAETLEDREDNYGSGEETFQAIADAWNAHLKPILTTPLQASDVAILMVLFKIARSKNKNSAESLDDLLDLVGYSAFAHDLRQAGS